MLKNTWLIEYTITAQRCYWYYQRGYTMQDVLHDNKDLDPVMVGEAWRDIRCPT